jgi:FAD/FMN-containing dehydrogenase
MLLKRYRTKREHTDIQCDNPRSADVVTADGRLVVAAATENDDLLWGLRGAGANLGIVTSFEYQLHQVGPVLGGMVIYPPDSGQASAPAL